MPKGLHSFGSEVQLAVLLGWREAVRRGLEGAALGGGERRHPQARDKLMLQDGASHSATAVKQARWIAEQLRPEVGVHTALAACVLSILPEIQRIAQLAALHQPCMIRPRADRQWCCSK